MSHGITLLRLVEPSLNYKMAMLDAASEMYAVGEWDKPPDVLAVQFDDILIKLAAAKDPATAPPGVLPYEDFWLMEGDAWIGLLTLRREINEQFLRSGGHIGYVIRPSYRRRGYGTALLQLGLERARDYGLGHVLLTCDDANIGSWKVIEANCGHLENTILMDGVLRRRYWIDLGSDEISQA